MSRSALNPTYDSAEGGRASVREFIELVRYRDLLFLMILNVVRSRYSRSMLGVLWSLMNPLMHTAVLTVAFSSLFPSRPHYAVYVLSGLLCWNFLSSATVHAMNSLVWGGSLLRRVYVPRTIFALAAVGHGLFNFMMALVPLVLLMLVSGHPLGIAVLFVPLSILFLTVFVAGMALLVSTLAVLFADVVELYQVLLQILFFLTPVMYPVEILPPAVQTAMAFNPVFYLIEMFRVPVYLGEAPGAPTVMAAAVSSVGALLVGWTVFTRRADEITYRV